MRDILRVWVVSASKKQAVKFRANTGTLVIAPGPMADTQAVVVALDMALVNQPTGTSQIKLLCPTSTVQTDTLHRDQTAILSAVFPRGSWGAFEVTCNADWIWSYCQLAMLQVH
jgi:hypothetical protein